MTAAAFTADLKQPPVLSITPPPHSRATVLARVAMRVSKISDVTFWVSLAGHVVSQTTLALSGGSHTLTWRPPRAGAWTVSLAAVDLAGNRASASAPVTILAAPRRHHAKHG